MKVFVSAIVRNKRTPELFLEKVNHFIFIDNNNISNIFHLLDDGLHLAESGRCILANNLIDHLNKFLLMHLHHPNTHTQNHKMQSLMEAF